MSSTLSLTAADFFTATVINQIDRKFILISFPRSDGPIIALVDQHAADERYRLETILGTLPTSIHPLDLAMEITIPEKQLRIISKRKNNLLNWGIEIQVKKDCVFISGIPKVLAECIDGAQWKRVLSSYLLRNADDCPSELMDMFCSKACRSVSPFGPRDDFRQSCLTIFLEKMSVRG
jgi:DNA mismatch repair ATPase MutL